MQSPEIPMHSEYLKKIRDNFVDELRSADNARKTDVKNETSLPFIVNELPSSPLVKDNNPFQVFVIGGTVEKKAICSKTENGIEIIGEEERDLPHLTKEEDFLKYIDSSVNPDTNAIAINFAYPMSPVFQRGRLDGKLLETSREKAISAQDLIGKNIGEEIEKYLSKKRGKNILVSVGNDSTCLLLSGKTQVSEDGLACGIVGTGLNFGLLLDQNTMVNLESADFDNFPPSDVGRRLAEKYGSPFGKEVNGWSLFHHFNAELDEKGISFPHIESTRQLSEISQQGIPTISAIAQRQLDRSARLVACQVAGITDFKGKDMTFVMEGSLFWKGNNYRKVVENTTKDLTERKVNFVDIKNSGVLGAAKLIA